MSSLLVATAFIAKSCSERFANILDPRLTRGPQLIMFDGVLAGGDFLSLTSIQGNNGYVITAVRPFTSVSWTSSSCCFDRSLTHLEHQQKMLDDLIELSNSYAAENREMRKRGQGETILHLRSRAT